MSLVKYGMAAWTVALNVKDKNKIQNLIIVVRITVARNYLFYMSFMKILYLEWLGQFPETKNMLFLQNLRH